jgi:hypothetical protein
LLENPEIQIDLKSKIVKYTKQNHGISQSDDYEMSQCLLLENFAKSEPLKEVKKNDDVQ